MAVQLDASAIAARPAHSHCIRPPKEAKRAMSWDHTHSPYLCSWIGQEWQISALCQQGMPHWAAVTMGKTSNNADNYIGVFNNSREIEDSNSNKA